LLDAEMDAPVVDEIRQVIAEDRHKAVIDDIHVWRVGKGKYAVVLEITTSADVDGDYYRRELAVHDELVHVTVEVHRVGPGSRVEGIAPGA
jgi:Co/Zn/Cd efflux system component